MYPLIDRNATKKDRNEKKCEENSTGEATQTPNVLTALYKIVSRIALKSSLATSAPDSLMLTLLYRITDLPAPTRKVCKAIKS